MNGLASAPRWGVALTVSVLVHIGLLAVLLAAFAPPAGVHLPDPVIRAELVARPVPDAAGTQPAAPSLEAEEASPDPPAAEQPAPTEPPASPTPDTIEETAPDSSAGAPAAESEPSVEAAGEQRAQPLDLTLPSTDQRDSDSSMARLYQPEISTERRTLGARPSRVEPGDAFIGMQRWAPTRFASGYRSLDARTPYQSFAEDTPIIGPILGAFNSGPVTNPNCPVYMEEEDCQSPFSSSLDNIGRVPGTSAFGADW